MLRIEVSKPAWRKGRRVDLVKDNHYLIGLTYFEDPEEANALARTLQLALADFCGIAVDLSTE